MNSPSQYFSQQIAEARYYCPSKRAPKAALDIVSAGWESCSPEYRISRRGFPWQAVELVVKGEGWLKLNKGKFRLRPGILFRYGRETNYEMVSDVNHPLQKYFVDFTGREARRALFVSPLQSGQVRQALYPNELGELFERILVEGNRKSNLSSAIAVNYLRLLFLKIEQCIGIGPGSGTSRSLASYLRSKVFFEENYMSSVNVEEAAEKLGLTSETLCRLFRRFSHVSPHQYLVKLRINFAVDLLLSTDFLTKEIGQKVGYPNPFHFSRTFKSIQGVSPETFRRLRRSLKR